MVQSRPAEPESSSSIEQALFQAVAAALGLPPGWKPGTEELRAVRESLFASTLDDDETLVIAGLGPDEDRTARLVSLRARHALWSATRRVAAERGVALPDPLPDVQVVRGTREASSTLTLLDAHRAAEPEARAPRALLLADDAALATLTAGAAPTESAAGVHQLAHGIAAVRASHGLAALEERVRAALGKAESGGSITPEDPLLGRLLRDKYLIKKRIGKGGFGTVYLAEDKGLGALVAIKVLNERAARSAGALQSFLQEAKLLTTLDHPNIVRWITFDQTQEGLHYFVMEYVRGKQLDHLLEETIQLPPRRVANILLQVVDALRAAHGQSPPLLHLDLKPNNVLALDRASEKEPERVKVIDFGISQSAGAIETPAAEAPAGGEPDEHADLERSLSSRVSSETLARDQRKNIRRARGGTALYASPEQSEHLLERPDIRPLDGRSDLYSLGVMAFRMLTGRFPFDSNDTRREALENHVSVAPHRVAKVGVRIPRRLAAFVDRCLQKDPELRWRDAEAAYRELDEIVHPRVKVLPIAAALVVVFGGVVVWIKMNQANAAPAIPTLTATDTSTEETFKTFAVSRATHDRTIQVHDWARQTGWQAEAAVPELRVVGLEGSEPLEGWRATWADPSKGIVLIEVVAPESTPVVSSQARLELRSPDQVIGRTDPFGLRFVAHWEIASLSVRDYRDYKENDATELDPNEQSLRVVINGPKSALVSIVAVRLFPESGPSIETLKASLIDEDHGIFDLPLDALSEQPEGKARLRVEVTDAANFHQEQFYAPSLAGKRIKITDATFLAGESPVPPPPQDEYLLSPELHTLRILFSRQGEAKILVKTDKGNYPFPSRPILSSRELRIPIVDLGLDQRSQVRRGSIEVSASDAGYVTGRSAEDKWPPLKFRFLPEKVTLDVAILDEGGVENLTLRSEQWNYVALPNLGKLSLRVTENVELPLRLKIDLHRPGSSSPDSQIIDLTSGTTMNLQLAASEPGEYEFTVSGAYFAGIVEGDVLANFKAKLFVESEKPALELRLEPPAQKFEGVPLVTSEDTKVCLVLGSGGPLVAEPTWVLTRPGKQPEDVSAESLGASLFDPHAEPRVENREFRVLEELFKRTQKAGVDGPYSLAVSAQNIADSNSKQILWRIDFDDPVVTGLGEPGTSTNKEDWVFPENLWKLRVSADDANGIDSVQVTAHRTEDGVTKIFEPLSPDAPGTYVLDSPPGIDRDWSQKEVTLVVTVIDHAGHTGSRPFGPNRMPPIKFDPPARITYGRDADDKMLLIQTNEVDYVACGDPKKLRPDEKRSEVLGLNIEAQKLKPFYLDVHEVTKAEFLAFVENGWPEDLLGKPDPELLSSLADRSQLPVTGVTLAEASAYARSRKKRLPTLLEWEYTVRGGRRGRANTLEQLPATPPPEGIDARPSEAPLPVMDADSADRCGVPQGPEDPSLVLWNLATNVSEWTWTPDEPLSAAFLLRPPQPPRPREQPTDLAIYYYIVGGSFQKPNFDYKAKRPVPESTRWKDLGFRCAMDASEVQQLLETREYHEAH